MATGSLFSDTWIPGLDPWERANARDRWFAEVVFPLPVDTIFRYEVPSAFVEQLQPGCRVEAPWGHRAEPMIGYCVGLTREAPAVRTWKSLTGLLDTHPLLDAQLLALTRWMAEYYLCSWGQVLDAVIPAGVKTRAGTRQVVQYTLTDTYRECWHELRLTPKQRAIVSILASAPSPLPADEICRLADCGLSPLQTLTQRGVLRAERSRTLPNLQPASTISSPPDLVLHSDQRHALHAILQAIRGGQATTFLLHGVTGSGKTEVYIRAIQEVVQQGRQAIVLVPEISLTPQTIQRFRQRFPRVSVLHSHLTDVERHSYWHSISQGEVQVVVGARSAIFAPTPHLGLIVIDEEHESSFKQENIPRYHAREVARKRAELAGVPLILGSATPTLESWLSMQRGEATLLRLPRRVSGLTLPPVSIVDIRQDPHCRQGRAIGRALHAAMQHALIHQGQVILFLNVRGFAPVLFCRACGYTLRCSACDVTLTWHKQAKLALCHLCGYQQPPPTRCPQCQLPQWRYLGWGTERLEHEVRQLFPEAVVCRMDSDTMQGRDEHRRVLEAFGRGEIQILLGTQMIAKGLDFPRVTLVGVVDADTALRQPDLRSRERTFQLLAQVAGRAGRGQQGGRVLIQTSCPEEPAIRLAARHDYLGFVKLELQHRDELQAPPWVSAIRVILRAERELQVAAAAEAVGCTLRDVLREQQWEARLLGPAPCPLLRAHGYYRYHLQLLGKPLSRLQQWWRTAAARLTLPPEVELAIDVDPLSTR
ncbi:MAG: primosomal protein N' [Planctomycetaceae bacterium]|nr:MAG: primosomal protein N' [Planctomycetaceae bacterium]